MEFIFGLQCGEPQRAVEVFRKGSEQDSRPNIYAYCSIISAFGKQKRKGLPFAELAYDLWKELDSKVTALDAAAYRTGIGLSIRRSP